MVISMHPMSVRGAILWSALASGVAGAQPGPVSAGVSVLASVPVGPLIGNRSAGAGAAASLRYVLPGLPSLAIRVEAAGLPTSSQANNAPDNAINMITNGSSALLAGIGPQWSVAVDQSRAYTTATAGIARVWATSALLPDNGAERSIGPPSVTRARATNFAWSAGGGIVMPLSSGRSRTAIDIGLRYYDLGRATYTTDYGPSCAVAVDHPVDRRASTLTVPGGAVRPRPVGRSALASPSLGGSLAGAVCEIIATTHHRTTFVAPSIGIVWHY
jgi:hypothetical protein